MGRTIKEEPTMQHLRKLLAVTLSLAALSSPVAMAANGRAAQLGPMTVQSTAAKSVALRLAAAAPRARIQPAATGASQSTPRT